MQSPILLNVDQLNLGQLKAAASIYVFDSLTLPLSSINRSNPVFVDHVRDLLVEQCPRIYYRGTNIQAMSQQQQQQQQQQQPYRSNSHSNSNSNSNPNPHYHSSTYTISNDVGDGDWINSKNLYNTMKRLRGTSWSIHEQYVTVVAADGEIKWILSATFVEQFESMCQNVQRGWDVA